MTPIMRKKKFLYYLKKHMIITPVIKNQTETNMITMIVYFFKRIIQQYYR